MLAVWGELLSVILYDYDDVLFQFGLSFLRSWARSSRSSSQRRFHSGRNWGLIDLWSLEIILYYYFRHSRRSWSNLPSTQWPMWSVSSILSPLHLSVYHSSNYLSISGVYSMLMFLIPSIIFLIAIWAMCPETSNLSVHQVLDDIARRKNLKVSFTK